MSTEEVRAPLGTGPDVLRNEPIRETDGRYLVRGYHLASGLLADPRIRPGTTGLDLAEAEIGGEYPMNRVLREMILLSLPPFHGAIRRKVQRWFTASAVDHLQVRIDRVCDRIIDDVRRTPADEPVDFVSRVAEPLPTAVIAELIGIPEPDRRRVVRWCRYLVQAMWFPVDNLRTANAAAGALEQYFGELIAARRRAGPEGPHDDLLEALGSDDTLTDGQVISNLVFLVIAASFTTSDFIGSAAVLAMEEPRFDRGLRDGRPVEPLITEALRLCPPIAQILRNSAEEIDADGVLIPRDSLIQFDVAAANRDGGVFDAPDRFDPDRNDGKPLSFGYGPHFCAGRALGQAEATAMLTRFWRSFDRIRPAAAPVPKHHPFQNGYKQILLRLG